MRRSREDYESALGRVTGRIHDRPFHLSWVRFDSPGSLVVLPFVDIERSNAECVRNWVFARRWRARMRWVILLLRNVRSLEVRDQSEVGRFQLDRITFDPALGRIVVSAIPPLALVMSSDEPNVEIREIGAAPGYFEYWSVFGCELESPDSLELPEGALPPSPSTLPDDRE